MIIRVIMQLRMALIRQNGFCFSGSDNFKNKGKGERGGGLFGQTKKNKQIKDAQQDQKIEIEQEKLLKSKKFLHKSQKTETEVPNQKFPPKRAQKKTPMINQNQKAEQHNLNEKKSKKKQEKQLANFQKLQKTQGLAQNIFAETISQNKVQPGLDQKFIELQTAQVYDKLCGSSQKLLDLFDSKDWQGLSSLLISYQTFKSSSYIADNFHHMLINRQPARYIQWLTATKTAPTSLSEKLLRKLLQKLIDRNQIQSIKQLTNVLQSKGIDIGYQFLDIVFAQIDKNASSVVLRQIIPPKIQLALYLLEFIQKSTPINQKNTPETELAENGGYLPGIWLFDLWSIVKQRHILLVQFIQIFQQLAIIHKTKTNLIETHANGLFLEVIQHYYFGSHLTSSKFKQLFSHIYDLYDFGSFMIKFRQILMQYKIKTGKNPLPNIKNHFKELLEAVKEEQIKKALFFFQLCVVQGGQQPFRIFQKNTNLLLTLKRGEQQTKILKDGLLCASKENLNSIQNDEQQSLSQNESQENVIFTRQDISKIQVFFYKNKDKQTIPEKLTRSLGLDKEHIDILSSRLQTQFDPEAYNKEKLEAGNIKRPKLNIDKDIEKQDEAVSQAGKDSQIGLGPKIISERLANQAYFLSSQDDSQRLFKDLLDDQPKNGEKGVQDARKGQGSQNDSQGHPLVQKISQFYKNQLQAEIRKQQNYLRRQLLKLVRFSQQPLDAAKAAIKMGKLQLAWTIFKQNIMRQTIKQRTKKNIDYVVRAFVLEHSKDNQETKIYDVIDSLNRFNFNYIDQVDSHSAKTEAESFMLNNSSFIESIYEKLQNFDHLVWQNLPEGKLKHQFWQSTLVLERADELLRLDAKGIIKDYKYERQHYELETKNVQQLFPQQLSWRDQLILSLGIAQPEQQPIKFQRDSKNTYLSFQNPAELKQYMVEPLINALCPPLQTKSQPLVQHQSETAEGEEVAAEGEEVQAAEGEEVAAEGEEVQAAEGEEIAAEGEELQASQGEEVQAAQGEEVQAAQGEVAAEAQQAQGEQAEVQEQAAQAQAEKQGQSQQALNAEQNEAAQVAELEGEQENASVSKASRQPELMGQTIYSHSLKHKIKGFDFNAFMEINYAKIKPFYQKIYEQQQKEFKKYFLALQALVQEAHLHDNHALQKKLEDVQAYLKDPYMISKMISYNLWNYDFITVEEPSQYLKRSSRFIQLFHKFKKYNGEKPMDAVPDLKKQRVDNFYQILHNRRVTQQLVEQLLMKRHYLFQEAESVVKIQPKAEVQQLILWGLFNDEPMAIYMGQKLAMLTNQKIPHKLALLVSKYLSHRQQISQNRVERCKQALRIVGRINRQNIYEMSKDYEHITVRKNLRNYIIKRKQEIDSSALNFLSRVQPTYSTQDTTFNLKNKISRGNLTL